MRDPIRLTPVTDDQLDFNLPESDASAAEDGGPDRPFRTSSPAVSDFEVDRSNRAQGRKGARRFESVRDACRRIRNAQSASRARLAAWLEHPAEEVLIALNRRKDALRVPTSVDLPQALLDGAIERADAEGRLWTPLLDRVTHRRQEGVEDRIDRLVAWARTASGQDLYDMLAFHNGLVVGRVLAAAPALNDTLMAELATRCPEAAPALAGHWEGDEAHAIRLIRHLLEPLPDGQVIREDIRRAIGTLIDRHVRRLPDDVVALLHRRIPEQAGALFALDGLPAETLHGLDALIKEWPGVMAGARHADAALWRRCLAESSAATLRVDIARGGGMRMKATPERARAAWADEEVRSVLLRSSQDRVQVSGVLHSPAERLGENIVRLLQVAPGSLGAVLEARPEVGSLLTTDLLQPLLADGPPEVRQAAMAALSRVRRPPAR